MTPLYKKKKPFKRLCMICDKRPEALQGQSAEPGIYIDMEIPSAARRRLTGAQKESRTGSNATGCEFYRDAAKNRCRRKCTAIRSILNFPCKETLNQGVKISPLHIDQQSSNRGASMRWRAPLGILCSIRPTGPQNHKTLNKRQQELYHASILFRTNHD